jgi:hypothetical protein
MAQRNATEARLKLLETQLEPHMLFNTLANLRVLITVDPPRAVAMLDRLNNYLRMTLSGSRALAHPLSAEFERLGDYLELMSVRMGERLRYTLDLPDDLREVPVPPLLLQPLVENSIRHGLEPKVEGGRSRARPRDAGRLVHRSARHRCRPRCAPPSEGSGFGLEQVRERLATVYGDQGRMSLAARAAAGVEPAPHITKNPCRHTHEPHPHRPHRRRRAPARPGPARPNWPRPGPNCSCCHRGRRPQRRARGLAAAAAGAVLRHPHARPRRPGRRRRTGRCWPTDEAPMPQLVFVTAYDEYAARAFEAQAIDYVLKPVQPERLRKTVLRLQQALAGQQQPKSAPLMTSARENRLRSGARCWPPLPATARRHPPPPAPRCA